MRFTHRARVELAFAAALLILAALGVHAYRSIGGFARDASWVAHTHEVLVRLASISRDLSEAESAQRGFVITEDEQYLDPYRGLRPRVAGELALRGIRLDQNAPSVSAHVPSATSEDWDLAVPFRTAAGEQFFVAVSVSDRVAPEEPPLCAAGAA